MRIAFYAPLKAPTHGTPSGDRRVAGLLMQALDTAGHKVELVSTFRSHDATGDPARQEALRDQGVALGRRLAAQWREAPARSRPDLWFTYHVYYKAPDWLGPEAVRSLGIPYVIAEASHAGKRAGGAWALGHRAAMDAIALADLLLCPIRDDIEGLQKVATSSDRIVHLPPFLEPAPYGNAARARSALRAAFARELGIDASAPWISIAAMMRPGDKLASFRALADTLARLKDLSWQLLVAGDGPARAEVEAGFAEAIPGRARLLGSCGPEKVATLYAASDLCLWPAVNEAYGMAMLEAQAAGIPVVSCASRGVPDVVEHGVTGLLAPSGDAGALAALARQLLVDAPRRAAMGRAAAALVGEQRSVGAAAATIDRAFARLPMPARTAGS